MEADIRMGKVPFYALDTFPHGISRSSYFNKCESEVLIRYGATLQRLLDGSLSPISDDEKNFINQMNGHDESYLYSVKLWKKYLAAVEKRRTFHGFSASSQMLEQPVNVLTTVNG